MKKVFLILPVLFFSFLIAGNVLAVGVDKSTYSSLSDTIEITFSTPFTWAVIEYETGAQLVQNYGDNASIVYSVGSLGITDLSNFHILFFTPGSLASAETNCPNPLREYSCVKQFIIPPDYKIIYNAPPVITGATGALGSILGVVISSSVDLASNVFSNYWPYVLVVMIIAGFITAIDIYRKKF